ncbi:two component transcriptional regulator, LuxR family [Gracilibacillus ureilyticus]|uniref:Two component transcriptional regulator, LuxR family n=1 Tax=Gracilibacillus ureilyticus TaxID=531814 RepID=A0A1H9MUS9_9BACI|nr:response regulator transcription factor [Gracilibacillus ureilyticus]SER27454.1 two component transcriptional regulator, LuxR family [Gracilibacillus ureilyticus]
MIKILLAEDQAIVRQGIKMMLETDPILKVTGEAKNGREALQLREQNYYDLAILDIRMPEVDGLQAAKELLSRFPEMKVLILTTFNDEEYAIQALKLGVHGYLLKDAEASQLIHSIKDCLAGGLQLPGEVAKKVVPHLLERNEPMKNQHTISLTKRETDILCLLGEGKSNKEIAELLALSIGTVKNHISQLLDKLQLRDRTQLAIYAIRNGYV